MGGETGGDLDREMGGDRAGDAAGRSRYLEEFVDAWKELDAVYLELLSLALWPREARQWEARWLGHERARRDTPPDRAGFEAAAERWRGEARELRGEATWLRDATPEQRARALDPWSALRRSGAAVPGGEPQRWPGWRQPLWLRALEADVDLPRPLLLAELDEAERQLGVRLPQDYRRFLLEVAAGVPCGLPAPDLAPLVRDATGRWSWDNIGTRTALGRLRETFPAREVDAPPDDEPRRENFVSESAYRIALAKWENDEPPYDRDPWAELTRGAVCLHSLGCGDALWLVVTGPAAGQIWADHLEHEAGFAPHGTGRGGVLYFGDWLRREYRG